MAHTNADVGAFGYVSHQSVMHSLVRQPRAAPAGATKGIVSDIMGLFQGKQKTEDTMVFTKPGLYQVGCPEWATVCMVTAVGAGAGGSGAFIQVADAIVSSGAGGASGCGVQQVFLEVPDAKKSIKVTVGRGGSGGSRNQIGAPGGPTVVVVGNQEIVLPGGGSDTSIAPRYRACMQPGQPGEPGISVYGSQGTPEGGAGGASLFSAGGDGGTPSALADSSGAAGAYGSGGGGACPWGSCRDANGGRGGHGFVKLQFLAAEPV